MDSHLNVINCFQHDGARAELTAAQNQMESIKEQIKAKDTYIMELQEKIEKHHSEANEARKVEQVKHLQTSLGHFFPSSSITVFPFAVDDPEFPISRYA